MRRNKASDLKCFNLSYFYCDDCGKMLTIPRKKSSQRLKDHKKTLWCPYCKQEKIMKEKRYCDHVRNMLGEIVA